MKKIFITTLILLILVVPATSCKNKSKDTPNKESEVEIDYNKIVFVNREELYKGMSVDEVKEKWGNPIDSIGSGLEILIYMESKESMLTLYFNMDNTLNRVESTDKNNNKKIILE